AFVIMSGPRPGSSQPSSRPRALSETRSHPLEEAMGEVVMPRAMDRVRVRRFPPWGPAAIPLALPLAGCFGARAEAPAHPGGPPPAPPRAGPAAPPPAPPTPRPPDPASDAAKDRARRTARLIQALDNPDSNRAYFAVVALLTDWAHDPSDRTGLAAI